MQKFVMKRSQFDRQLEKYDRANQLLVVSNVHLDALTGYTPQTDERFEFVSRIENEPNGLYLAYGRLKHVRFSFLGDYHSLCGPNEVVFSAEVAIPGAPEEPPHLIRESIQIIQP